MLMLVIAMGALSASASLVMRVDTENEVLYFEGSDSGAGSYAGGPYAVDFQNDAAFSGDYQLGLAGSFSESVSANIAFNPDDGIKLQALSFSGDITSLTGTGSAGAVSYASFSEADKTLLEGKIGEPLSLLTGSGYSPIAIQAIPEPATIALRASSASVHWLFDASFCYSPKQNERPARFSAGSTPAQSLLNPLFLEGGFFIWTLTVTHKSASYRINNW